MNQRYVLQVLLVTLGFGVLLAVIAVLDTPADWSRPLTGASTGSAVAEPARTTTSTSDGKTTPRAADFKDECEFPARLIRDCPQPEPQEACERTSPSHKKSGTTAE